MERKFDQYRGTGTDLYWSEVADSVSVLFCVAGHQALLKAVHA